MAQILLVDDESIIRNSVGVVLEKLGHRVTAVADGAEALRHMHRDQPELILMDLDMPCMNGLEVIRRLRSIPKGETIPIIMMTASADRSHVLEAAKLGVKQYFLKSQFSIEELSQRVKQALSGGATAKPNDDSDLYDSPAASAPDADTVESEETEKSPQESLKEMKPRVTRSEVLRALEDFKDIEGLSPAAAQVIELTNDKNCTIDELSKAIKQDPALSVKLLKLANSVVYRRGSRVDSVQQAIMRIGMAHIRQTVQNLELMDQLNRRAAECQSVAIPQLWEHSIGCSLIASMLADQLGGDGTEVDLMFTAGLLHDVGRMLLAIRFPELYDEVVQIAREHQLPLQDVEKRLMLLDHAAAMDRPLHVWRFSRPLIDPIVFHHVEPAEIRHKSPKAYSQVAQVALANRLAHAAVIGSSTDDMLYPIHEFKALVPIDGEGLLALCRQAEEQTRELRFVLLSQTDQSQWPDSRKVLREQLNRPVAVQVLSDDPQWDIVRLFLELLLGTSDSPDVLVLSITQEISVASLRGKIAEAMQRWKKPDLPIVVVGSGKDVLPNIAELQLPQVTSASLPLRISDLIGMLS